MSLGDRFREAMNEAAGRHYDAEPDAPRGLAPHVIATEYGQAAVLTPPELSFYEAEMSGEWIAAPALVEVTR